MIGRAPIPLPDELISSWVVRLARRLGQTPYVALANAIGSQYGWCRDTDLALSQAQVIRLAAYGQLSPDLLGAHSLPTVLSANKQGISPGVLSYGVRHRLRTRHGLQYCPGCLAEDREPYLRREWRSALQFGCSVHGVLLRDACPRCDRPLMPYRCHDGNIRRCSECGASLIKASAKMLEVEIAQSKWVSGALHEQVADIGGTRASIRELGLGIRLLYSFLATGRAPDCLVELLPAGSLHAEVARQLTAPIEIARISDRASVLPQIIYLLDDWPTSFVARCREQGVSRNRIVDGRSQEVPAWIEAALQQLHSSARPRKRRTRRRSGGKGRVSYRAAFQQLDLTQYLRQTIPRPETSS